MAKLRIEDAGGNLIVDEYVRVVEGLFLKVGNNYPNYQDFIEADPDERPALLQQFVVGVNKITQQKEDGTTQPINGNNCAIITEKDRRKKANLKRSRVTVPMPDAPPEPLVAGDPVFKYLLPYAKQIHDLYHDTDAAKIDKCTKFMFGVMLLTRCR